MHRRERALVLGVAKDETVERRLSQRRGVKTGSRVLGVASTARARTRVGGAGGKPMLQKCVGDKSRELGAVRPYSPTSQR